MMRIILLSILLVSALTVSGCAKPAPDVLRLATTTSTDDSGLLEFLLPEFEDEFNVQVDVIAVGTGQAVALGENGDADVILVHNLSLETAFVEQGYGVERFPVAFNDFILLGPQDDPAGVAAASSATEALKRIASSGSDFASRGDDSGTHAREQSLWKEAGLEPSAADSWYLSLGQGMGETLLFTEERSAYTLSDRGTYLAQSGNLPGLTILFGGASIADNPDTALLNPYGVIAVSPERHPGAAIDLAQDFIAWLTGLHTQERIATFGVDRFGQPLFHPDSVSWRESS
jgi:tungstate transport system substrate-binding protein